MEHIHHVGIALIFVLVNIEDLFVFSVFLRLVKNTQHCFKAVVHAAFEPWYLHYDAVVSETLHEWLFLAVSHHVAVVVIHVVVHVDDGFLNVAYAMAEQVHRHHGIGVALWRVVAYVYLIAVLRAEVLAETQRLRVEPRLLQLYQHHAVFQLSILGVFLAHRGGKVDAEHREGVACGIDILVWAHLHFHHVLLQQCRKDGLGYAFVRHDVLEHGVVNRVGYMQYHKRCSLQCIIQMQTYTK